MKRFRRRSSRSREPLFWSRTCFAPSVVVSNLQAGLTCDTSVVANGDQLAVGGVTFSALDEEYTCRRIRWPCAISAVGFSQAAVQSVMVWAVVAKLDTTALALIVAAGTTFQSLLIGQTANLPGALDILDIKHWNFTTFPGGTVVENTVFQSQDQPKDFDVRVARRLGSNECIALLTGGYIAPTSPAFGTASFIRVDFNIISSVLYSRTLRRR